jgi:hypothetical protein
MKDKGIAEITHLEDSTMVLRTTVSVQSWKKYQNILRHSLQPKRN